MGNLIELEKVHARRNNEHNEIEAQFDREHLLPSENQTEKNVNMSEEKKQWP